MTFRELIKRLGMAVIDWVFWFPLSLLLLAAVCPFWLLHTILKPVFGR
jgi:hypothetical protein